MPTNLSLHFLCTEISESDTLQLSLYFHSSTRGQSYKANFGINSIKNKLNKLNFTLNYINFDVIYAPKSFIGLTPGETIYHLNASHSISELTLARMCCVTQTRHQVPINQVPHLCDTTSPA